MSPQSCLTTPFRLILTLLWRLDYDNDTVPDLMVKFNAADVINYILNNINVTKLLEKKFLSASLTITGYLNDGTKFQGSDIIKITMPMPRKHRALSI